MRFFLIIPFLAASLLAEKPKLPLPAGVPFGASLSPKEEQPVFAVASKQGARVLVSRDDGVTWKQTLLGTDNPEDGGWHGQYAVYGMAQSDGVIGVFSGWGPTGYYLGSDNGTDWVHLTPKDEEAVSLWDAAAGKGVMITSADQWRGIQIAEKPFQKWRKQPLKDLLDGGKTHHIICGFGDFEGGRFIAIGDNRHVFYSEDLGKNWLHSHIPEPAPDKGQNTIAFGNGVFMCDYEAQVARSVDGGKTWTLHSHGLNKSAAWRGLSFVRGEFWLTSRNGGGRKSKDGITWTDLPEATPAGRFVEDADTGTLINVCRKRHSIMRSTDDANWKTVFEAPTKDVTWSFSFATQGNVRK